MILSSILLYTVAWAFLYHSFTMLKSNYLKKETQKNNAMTVAHAVLSPLLCFLYFCTIASPFGFYEKVNALIIHACLFSIGYYIFSMYKGIQLEKKFPKLLVFHHFAGIAYMACFALFPESPSFLGWGLLLHAAAAPYHTYLVIKETPGHRPEKAQFWYNMNYYSWMFFRVILHTIYFIAFLYYDFAFNDLSLAARIYIYTIFIIAYGFNLYWMVLIIKRRKQKKKAILSTL